jgi:hypothetical protein
MRNPSLFITVNDFWPVLRTICCLLLLLACSGCHLLRKRQHLEPTPVVFATTPTSLDQILQAVNSNTSRVQMLQSRDARLHLRGLPGITVDIAYEQPRRFRFRAGTGLTGQELDLGSNEDLFWFWAKQNPQPAIYFARHELFARSPQRQMIPIEPMWIVDALGLPTFQPHERHEGPFPRGDNQLEIRTRVPAADGEFTKVTLIDGKHAWVMQEHLYDPRGRLLASATLTDQEYYPFAQVALPRKVTLDIPAAQLSFYIESSGYLLNQPFTDSNAIFSLPQDQLPNYPLVDIADPRLNPANSVPVQQPSGAAPPHVNIPTQSPSTAYQLPYRGSEAIHR